jgi:hypothetical protein
MKTLFLALFLSIAFFGHSQYYYNDIIGAKAIGERMKVYVANKVKSVTAVGLDKQGAKTSDFNEWQEVIPQTNILRSVHATDKQ